MDMERINNDMPLTLKFPFLCLSKFGLFSTHSARKHFLLFLFAVCLVSLLVINILQFTNIEKDVYLYVKGFEGIAIIVQALGKIILVMYQNNNFVNLAQKTKLFWNTNICSKESKKKINAMHHLIPLIQKLFFLNATAAATLFTVDSLIQGDIPIGIWTLEGHQLLYHCTLVQQILVLPVILVFVSTLDCKYLGFCTEIVVQFKILCKYMEEITVDGNDPTAIKKHYLEKMKDCICHHVSMLRFVEEFQKTFSGILFLEYITVGPIICMELFAIFESDAFDISVARHAITFGVLVFQLSFYCIPANYIADEALAVANGAYFSNWYINHLLSLKPPLLLMMQNSQKTIEIRAGGLIRMNAATVLNVLKVAWSACSLMRGLRKQ